MEGGFVSEAMFPSVFDNIQPVFFSFLTRVLTARGHSSTKWGLAVICSPVPSSQPAGSYLLVVTDVGRSSLLQTWEKIADHEFISAATPRVASPRGT